MKVTKARVKMQCSSIVQPGEYMIDRWDNTRCSETHPHHLIKCEGCGQLFCLIMHWHKHMDEITEEHYE